MVLGCVLGASGPPLGRSCGLLGASWLSRMPLPSISTGFGRVRAGFWKAARPGFGTHFAYTRLMYIMHLIAAGTSLLHLLTLFFSPLQRGGTCAAHGIGAKLAVLGSQDPPQSLQNPVFWAHVSKMLPKRLQSGSKGVPRRAQRSIFGAFSMNLGAVFSIFLAVKTDYLNRHSRHHMYLLSDAIT